MDVRKGEGGERREVDRSRRQRCLRGREEISKRILLPPSLQLRPFGNMALPAIQFHARFPNRP